MVASLLKLILAKKTDIFKIINKIFIPVKQLTQKALITKTSTRLLGLEFTSDNMMKSKAMKYFFKKILPKYK